MTTILLIVIYLAFISLGLPDALLGVAWPQIRLDWGLGLDAAGIISIVITGGTIASSLLSGKLIKRFGEGKITLLSGLMTGFALLGYGFAPSFLWFILLALPLGFGAGSVDTALNHYVATHFKAHHMNWLHSFWGVGATAGPVLMGAVLATSGSWRNGYFLVAGIQLVLATIIFISLPLWRLQDQKSEEQHSDDDEPTEAHGKDLVKPLKKPGVIYALLVFMAYCSGEYTMGLWGASYLVQVRGIAVESAANWVASYYAGITLGRFLAGFLSFKLNNRQMITLGLTLATLGGFAMFVLPSSGLLMIAFVLVGLGFAPIFPAMVHETPKRFGKQVAQSVIGYQMASAYVGIAVFPPLFGVVMKHLNLGLFPLFIILCVSFQIWAVYRLNRITHSYV
ncbi:MAG: MFS transporter [Clostridiales bacterium 38-18]|nr:MAG: MFS transporter [Clostridiales bacterium 38-18]